MIRTHVSPSQIDTALLCVRKWSYVKHRPRTQNKWAAFGDRVHVIRETWLRHGVPPDPATPEGKCSLVGLENLPMPGTCLVEWSFSGWSDGEAFVPDPDEQLEAPLPWVRYVGRVDFLYGWDRTMIIGDHKTCGDLIRAAEMRAKQHADPQHVIYPFVVAALVPGVEHIATQWEYLRRPAGKVPAVCEPVHDVIPVETVRARFRAMHHAISVHLREWAHLPPESFPRNLKACGAFGGCPFRGECHVGVSTLELAAAQLESNT